MTVLNLNIPLPAPIPGPISGSNSSVPLTPTHQTIPTPTRMLRHRNSSCSSLATSDDEDYLSSTGSRLVSRDNFKDWTPADDDFLLTVYERYLSNPTIAPFAGDIPPSGIATRVAKETAKKAKIEGKLFNHSLNAIRKRLLLLCRRRERSNSITSQSSTISQSGSPRGCRLSFDTNMDNMDTNMDVEESTTSVVRPATPLHKQTCASFSFEDFQYSENKESSMNNSCTPCKLAPQVNRAAVRNWLFNDNSPGGPSPMHSNEVLPMSPYSPSARITQRRRPDNGNSLALQPVPKPFATMDKPLASPFREKTSLNTPPNSGLRAGNSQPHTRQLSPFITGGGSPSNTMNDTNGSPSDRTNGNVHNTEPSEDPFLNYTSWKKRASLNNKRGVRQ